MDYEPVIGLEVHVQLKTASKLFCGCSTKFGALPNAQVCPVCLGYPGVLPVLNEKALTLAVMAGLAMGSTVALYSKFDRKNYFYPDLPKAYQVSQYDEPICLGGKIDIEVEGTRKEIRLTRIHLEEDAGKSMHFKGDTGVDYNRTGIPLIEIVSEPDLRSPQEAYQYLKELKTILEYLDVSDCNMEEGSLRCDANVSLRPVGEKKMGTRAEIKNLNSFHNVEKAITYEIERQKELLSRGERIVQETRLWNADESFTRSMRSKEAAHDYRYFPEPDLVPIVFSAKEIESVRVSLPELAQRRKERFMKDFALTAYDAEVLTAQKDLADFFERCLKYSKNAKAISNWMMGDLMRELKLKDLGIAQSPMSPEHIAGLIELMDQGKISGKMAKDVFLEMFGTGKSAQEIVSAKGLSQLSDSSQIEGVVKKVIQENPPSVQDYRNGKKNALSYLVGQVMKATQGRANPKMVNELLVKELEK
ncbi:MAG: Asp-tRNA(Asn)/Glu-tRNA(Gln) amidotransferase subunit GatB [Chlamydiae bacterium]|nr:Asp-tRNA(Asn)/Glu-tRNA(Gln) amidotransferase subunit GatB [Chlamydiota bacterium]MBI3265717.1 Asp-tRNA(Asn)/Glu-tRNA(Gln) amidotransferase subunit GatB [Chlamydiota bacterium]